MPLVSVPLPLALPVCLCPCVSVCLCLCLSFCPCFCVSLCPCLSLFLSVSVFLFLSFPLSLSLSVSLSLALPLSPFLFPCPFVPLCPYVSVSLSLSACPSVSVSLLLLPSPGTARLILNLEDGLIGLGPCLVLLTPSWVAWCSGPTALSSPAQTGRLPWGWQGCTGHPGWLGRWPCAGLCAGGADAGGRVWAQVVPSGCAMGPSHGGWEV